MSIVSSDTLQLVLLQDIPRDEIRHSCIRPLFFDIDNAIARCFTRHAGWRFCELIKFYFSSNN
jgi:hypothetical protein